MRKAWIAVCAVALVAAFLVLNRAAYKGYFQDDEFDNLAWAPYLDSVDYLKGAVSLTFFANNFRPVGHFYFHEGIRFFGLDFPKYVGALQVIHLLNVWLLWLVARRLRAPPLAAYLGCIFFALHMALFDDVWKPMYAFDVLCGSFCLLAILCWIERRWVLSFIAFWLAYRAKEVAVMLPAVLACYELWLGKRQVKPLIPFFAASLSFGLQGLLLNPNKDNDYTFRFTFAALRQTATYYAGRVFLVPYLGFLAPLAALPGRNRRTWFGLAMAGILFFPILFLPGRLFSAYCYVPFLGLALALSGLAEAVGPIPVAVALLVFAPIDLHELRARRSATLALDDQIRGWVAPVANFARTKPALDAVVWSGEIPGFAFWGVEGAVHCVFHNRDLKIAEAETDEGRDLLARRRVAFVVWNPAIRHSLVTLRDPNTPDSSYVDFDRQDPVWQLANGWFGLEAGYRWTHDTATARLSRPEGARRFSLRVLAGPARLQAGPVTLKVWLNERELEPRRITASGWQEVFWDLPPATAGEIEMKLLADPPFHPDPNSELGIAVGAFGFPSALR